MMNNEIESVIKITASGTETLKETEKVQIIIEDYLESSINNNNNNDKDNKDKDNNDNDNKDNDNDARNVEILSEEEEKALGENVIIEIEIEKGNGNSSTLTAALNAAAAAEASSSSSVIVETKNDNNNKTDNSNSHSNINNNNNNNSNSKNNTRSLVKSNSTDSSYNIVGGIADNDNNTSKFRNRNSRNFSSSFFFNAPFRRTVNVTPTSPSSSTTSSATTSHHSQNHNQQQQQQQQLSQNSPTSTIPNNIVQSGIKTFGQSVTSSPTAGNISTSHSSSSSSIGSSGNSSGKLGFIRKFSFKEERSTFITTLNSSPSSAPTLSSTSSHFSSSSPNLSTLLATTSNNNGMASNSNHSNNNNNDSTTQPFRNNAKLTHTQQTPSPSSNSNNNNSSSNIVKTPKVQEPPKIDFEEIEKMNNVNIYDEPAVGMNGRRYLIYLNQVEVSDGHHQQQHHNQQSINNNGNNYNLDDPKQQSSSQTSDLQVYACSLNKIVEVLTDKNVLPSFVNVCLHCYRSFCTPEAFFSKLKERYNVQPPPASLFMPEEEWKHPVQAAVLNFLASWLEINYSDFPRKFISQIKDFLDNEVVIADSVSATMDAKENVKKVLKNKSNMSVEARRAIRIKPQFDINNGVKMSLEEMNSVVLDKYDAEVIADHICLIDFNFYSSIKASELIDTCWSKKETRHRCANVLAMIKRFNDMSEWVGSSIVYETKVKDRAKLFTKFVKIAESLRKKSNFNALLAITSGLGCSAVHRLTFTRNEVSKSVLQLLLTLVKTMSPDGAYRSYRQAESESFGEGGPTIPYLGVYLTDLTFIDQGNPNYVEENLINFQKRMITLQVIEQALRFQSMPYSVAINEQLFSHLNNLPSLTETEMYALSLRREPRNAEKSAIL